MGFVEVLALLKWKARGLFSLTRPVAAVFARELGGPFPRKPASFVFRSDFLRKAFFFPNQQELLP